MKTIKQTRQVRLDELLKYVWDNDIKNESFFTKESEGYISVDSDGDFCMYGRPHVNKDERFTITEEVEIDGNTVLDVILVFDEYSGNKNYVGRVFRISINRIIKINNDGNIKFIYLQNEDGSIGDLIWSKERGLID